MVLRAVQQAGGLVAWFRPVAGSLGWAAGGGVEWAGVGGVLGVRPYVGCEPRPGFARTPQSLADLVGSKSGRVRHVSVSEQGQVESAYAVFGSGLLVGWVSGIGASTFGCFF